MAVMAVDVVRVMVLFDVGVVIDVSVVEVVGVHVVGVVVQCVVAFFARSCSFVVCLVCFGGEPFYESTRW